MPLRTRCAISAAVGALLATAALASPATADDGWDPNSSTSNSSSSGTSNGTANGNGNGTSNGTSSSSSSGTHHQESSSNNSSSSSQHFYKGVVTAGTLALRSKPTRGSQVIRYAHRGDIVKIYCKTGGENIDGNYRWYLLADGTWAWGAARYIDNVGPAPRWC